MAHIGRRLDIADVDPESLGCVLGSGTQSVVIQPYMEYDSSHIDQAVLVITQEPEKCRLLYNIYQYYDNLKVEEVCIDDLDEDYRHPFKLLEDEGLFCFYSSKLQPASAAGLENDFVLDAFDLINDHFTNIKLDSESLNIEDTFEQIEAAFQKIDLENDDNVDAEFFNEISVKLVPALKNAFQGIKDMGTSSLFTIDIHDEQFMYSHCQGELICIDPALFNFNY